MILRRVIAHVKKQEWTAVALDFLIVVMGVFIGIQLGNWNAARIAAAEESRILERLASDFEKQEATLLQRLEDTRYMLGNIDRLVALIDEGSAPEDEAAVSQILVDIFGVSVREAPPASYEELAASGGFAQLSDIAIRDALAEYGQTNALWNYVELRSEAVKDPNSPLVQAIILKPGFSTGASEADSIAYEWEKLKQARPVLLLITVNMVQALDRHQKDLAAVRTVLDALEAAQ